MYLSVIMLNNTSFHSVKQSSLFDAKTLVILEKILFVVLSFHDGHYHSFKEIVIHLEFVILIKLCVLFAHFDDSTFLNLLGLPGLVCGVWLETN